MERRWYGSKIRRAAARVTPSISSGRVSGNPLVMTNTDAMTTPVATAAVCRGLRPYALVVTRLRIGSVATGIAGSIFFQQMWTTILAVTIVSLGARPDADAGLPWNSISRAT